MTGTITIWDSDKELDVKLQEDVSDCVYRVFMSNRSPVRRAGGKTESSIMSELDFLISDTVQMLHKRPGGSKIKSFRVVSLEKDGGRYIVDTRIQSTDRIAYSRTFNIGGL